MATMRVARITVGLLAALCSLIVGADMPAVRAVRYQAAKYDYRMQTIILGIVESVPFTMRRTPTT